MRRKALLGILILGLAAIAPTYAHELLERESILKDVYGMNEKVAKLEFMYDKETTKLRPEKQGWRSASTVSGSAGILVYGTVNVELKGYKGKYGSYYSGIIITLREESTEQERKEIKRFDLRTGRDGCFHIIRPIPLPRPPISYTIERIRIPKEGVDLPAGNHVPVGAGEKIRQKEFVPLFIGQRYFKVNPTSLQPGVTFPAPMGDQAAHEKALSCVLEGISQEKIWARMMERELEGLRILSRLGDLEREKRYDEAHALLKNFLTQNPEGLGDQNLHSTLFVRQLKWLREEGRLSEANNVLSEATKTINDPKEGKNLWWEVKKLGEAFYNKGEHDNAISVFTNAIKLSPEYEEAYCERARVWIQKKEYNLAVSDCTKAVELNPKNIRAYYYRSWASNAIGQYERSVIDLTRLIELNPKNPAGYNALAWLLATCPEEKYRNGVLQIRIRSSGFPLTLPSPPCSGERDGVRGLIAQFFPS